MAKITYSFSLTNERDQDIIKAIEEAKNKGINLSALIRDLLKRYFFGDHNDYKAFRLSELERLDDKGILEFVRDLIQKSSDKQ